MNRQRAGLQAYRELYGAVCELSESLFDQAVAMCRDERQAAALASCNLVRALQQGRRASGSGLMRRLSEVRWSGARQRATSSPG